MRSFLDLPTAGRDAGLDWSAAPNVTLRLRDSPISTDATLSGLAVNDGRTDVTLTPTFASGTYAYAASVANVVAEVTVTPMTTDDGAEIEYLNASDMTLADAGMTAGQQVALAVGDNVIKVKVTAEDGMTTRTYTVTVTRAPTCTPNTAAGDIWCGVVTVGTITSSGTITGYGFSSSAGNLSDTGFSVGTNNYTISGTSIVAPGASGAGTLGVNLTSALTAADKAKLVLHIDGNSDTFAFSDAFVAGSTYSWVDAGLDWSSTPNVTLRLRDGSSPGDANAAPSFTSSDTFNPAENQTAVDTVEAEDSDTTDDITGYALSGGADQALFAIDDSGALTFQAAPNYEDPKDANTDNAYVVVVRATSGTGAREKTADQTITVTVMDEDEQPDKPAKPTVSATSGSSTSLDASWTAPGRNGGPEITGYEVQYQSRASATDAWSAVVDWPHTGTTTTTTITGLTADTEYQVQVRALNGETPSDWSDYSDAVRTNSAADAAPVFSETAPTRAVPENSAAGTDVGEPVTASDADGDTLEYTLEGTDASSFAIVSTSGQIRTTSGVTYDYEEQSSYAVTMKASDATASATIDVTINLTDEDEQPDKPAKPTLAAVSGSATSLTARWTKPGRNGGPDITGYNVEYREGTSGDWETFTHGGTGVARTITGLMASTSYQVRVQALNGETPSAWSDPSDAVTPNAGVPGDEGQFRLNPDTVEGYSDDTLGRLNGHVGRAEVFHAERWGTVSDDGLLRTGNEASALVCQAMDYDTGEFASGYGQPGVPSQPFGLGITKFYPVGSTYPPDGPLPIWLDDLSCVSGDTDLTGVNALKAPMAHCGYAGWGLHNSTHSEDAGVRCWNELESDAGRSYDPLTAAFEGLPEAHDGETAFSFRLAFSEAVAVTPEAMRTRALTVAGGAVTGAARVDGESGVWEITVTPDSREDLSITLAPAEDCEAEGAVCTSDGRTLSAVPAHIVPGPGPETEPALTASFEGLPEVHDGEEGFHFRVAFSEEIGIGFRSMRDDSFTVDGGEVTAARRVEGRHDLWRITVEPDSDEDVAIALPGGRECAVSGAICTRGENRRQLANTPTATVAGPPERNTAATGAPTISGTAQVGEALTASTSGISDADGLDDARFAYQWIRTDTDIGGATGATYTPVAADEGTRLKVRVSFTDDAGNAESLTSAATDAVTAAPELNTAATGTPAIGGTPQVGEALSASTSGISDADGLANARFGYQWIRTDTDIQGATGATYTAVDADEGKRLKVRVSFTDDAGNAESLTSAATDAVAARPEPLTASFEGMPAEHAGQGSFSFRVAFSDGINISYKTVRDASFTVTGGEVTAARRVDGRRDLWKITIAPASHEALTVRLPETTDCDAGGAICTSDGRPLSHSLSATVAGPVGIAVADARVEEGDGVALAFAVTLSRAASAALTVDYATADGSAHAGDDYRAASGTLTFAAGESSQTIEVAVLDDAHDEGEETLTLRLSNPSGGRLADGEATGTIENHDPMPRALLGAVRADGGGARGRARGRAAPGAARAGLPGPVRGPRAAAGDGARHRAQLPAPARRDGRRGSAGRGRGRSAVRRAGGRDGAARDAGACRRRRASGRGVGSDGRRDADGRRARCDGHGGRPDGRPGRAGRPVRWRRTLADGPRRR